MSLIEAHELDERIRRILDERKERTPMISTTLRVPRAQWPAVKEAAARERVSVQEWLRRAVEGRLAA